MTNKVYDILKYIAQIVLPAVGTLYAALAPLWNLPYAEPIVGTIVAVDAFLGALLKISSDQYYKHGKDVLGTLAIDPQNETASFNFDETNAETLLNAKTAKVKVEVYEGKHEAE
jgi:hypothetical protein